MTWWRPKRQGEVRRLRCIAMIPVVALAIGACGSTSPGASTHASSGGKHTATRPTNRISAAPALLPLHAGISANSGVVCSLLGSGQIKCWGDDSADELGSSVPSSQKCSSGDDCSLAPVQIAGVPIASAVSLGSEHACALARTGTVWCWGDNKDGELGDGSTTASATPVQVSGLANATALSAGGAGDDFSCAVIRGGQVRCWGYDNDGELGDGATTNSSVPVAVRGITNAVSISAGGSQVCALLAAATVSCWGDNVDGQVGMSFGNDPTIMVAGESYTTTPVTVSGLTNVAAVSAGWTDACALTKSGKVYCWGFNGDGELGNGATSGPGTCNGQQDCSYSPVAVSGVSDAVAIGAGGDASCAVLSIGSVDCWGGEYTGELGNGKIANGSDPTATGVLGISDAVAVGAGSGYACALLKSGAVQCWGDNSTGELATGSTHSADATPVAIQGIP